MTTAGSLFRALSAHTRRRPLSSSTSLRKPSTPSRTSTLSSDCSTIHTASALSLTTTHLNKLDTLVRRLSVPNPSPAFMMDTFRGARQWTTAVRKAVSSPPQDLTDDDSTPPDLKAFIMSPEGIDTCLGLMSRVYDQDKSHEREALSSMGRALHATFVRVQDAMKDLTTRAESNETHKIDWALAPVIHILDAVESISVRGDDAERDTSARLLERYVECRGETCWNKATNGIELE